MLDLSISCKVFGLEYRNKIQLPNKKLCDGAHDFLVLSTKNRFKCKNQTCSKFCEKIHIRSNYYPQAASRIKTT